MSTAFLRDLISALPHDGLVLVALGVVGTVAVQLLVRLSQRRWLSGARKRPRLLTLAVAYALALLVLPRSGQSVALLGTTAGIAALWWVLGIRLVPDLRNRDLAILLSFVAIVAGGATAHQVFREGKGAWKHALVTLYFEDAGAGEGIARAVSREFRDDLADAFIDLDWIVVHPAEPSERYTPRAAARDLGPRFLARNLALRNRINSANRSDGSRDIILIMELGRLEEDRFESFRIRHMHRGAERDAAYVRLALVFGLMDRLRHSASIHLQPREADRVKRRILARMKSRASPDDYDTIRALESADTIPDEPLAALINRNIEAVDSESHHRTAERDRKSRALKLEKSLL
jgi:hypothetical protein